MRIRRCRSRSCTRRSARTHTRLPLIVLLRRPRRLPRRIRAAVLGVDDGVSAERRRQAAPQLAGVHSGHVRVHDPRRRAVGGVRHAGVERPAAAVSPGVQRAAVRAGEPQPLLSVHRSDAIPEVRSREDARVSRNAEPARGNDRCRVAVDDPRPTGVSVFWAGRVARASRRSRSSRAAGRTCTINRSTGRCEKSTFFADGLLGAAGCGGHGRARRTCATTRCSIPARSNGVPAPCSRFAVDASVMARGQERFNIFCSPCHGRTGMGDGMVVQRGYRRPPPFDDAAAARGAGRPLLRRDDERLRRDARLRGANRGRRSLGDRRLYPGAAAERAGRRLPTCRPPSGPGSRTEGDDARAETAGDADP